MLKLVNISLHDSDLKKFNYNQDQMKEFLSKNGLDGFEMILYKNWSEKIIPSKLIKGFHMRYFPIWLDFWKENKEALLKQMGSEENIKKYYGVDNKKGLIDLFKNEIEVAQKTDAEYLVFHVSHVELQHIFNYQFTYTDDDVLDSTIELINEVFTDQNCKLKLLFENLWWPGLTFCNKKIVDRLMSEVNYSNKGFMLDISHLMNTNHDLQTESEAVDYILDLVSDLGDSKKYIQGIHLNSSLSGEYVKETIKKSRKDNRKVEVTQMDEVYKHITKIDKHIPFEDKRIKEVIEFIKPKYLLYEVLTDTLEELQDYVDRQNEALGYN